MSTTVPSDIKQRIVDDFGPDRADSIFDYLLTRIPSGLANGTRPRHLRCILYLAKGDTQQLDNYIEMCLFDTRDVMVHAEYETDANSENIRVRDFSRPFGKAELKKRQ